MPRESDYRRNRASRVMMASATVVRMEDTQIRVLPSARIWTMDSTEARMDTIPNRVMRLMTVSLRACYSFSWWAVRILTLALMSWMAVGMSFTSSRLA